MKLNRRILVRRLLDFGRPLLPWLGASTLFRILGMGCGIALLALGAGGVAEVVTRGATAPIGRIVVTMIVLALAKGVLRYLEQYTGHYVAFRLLAQMRDDFYRKVEPLAPAAFTTESHSGDLLARAMKDINRIEVFYAHTVAPMLAAVVLPAASLIFLGIAVHPVFALVLLPFVAVTGFVVPWLSHQVAVSAADDLLGWRALISSHLVDGIQGVREVLSFGYGDRRTRELGAISGQVERARSRLGTVVAIRRGVNELLVGGALVAQLVVGIALVTRGAITWTELPVALAITAALFPSVLAVEEFAAELEQAFRSAARIFEFTDRRPVVQEASVPAASVGVDSSITFDEVTFAYPADGLRAPALADVSFKAPAGRTTAIVGTSGAGKSTLLWLLLRFWDPDSGRILIGGGNIKNLSLAELRQKIAVVTQRTHLFNESVAANLRIARPSAADSEIEEACRRAAIHEFVMTLPQQYDSQIGEMGERLSGGQRQRLAIARALLKDAPILVLDEATSELDVENERAIQHELDALAEGRTTLVIAHRLATVVTADEIIVLDRGRIVERGTHADLFATDGAYSRLWSRQEDATSRTPGRSPSLR